MKIGETSRGKWDLLYRAYQGVCCMTELFLSPPCVLAPVILIPFPSVLVGFGVRAQRRILLSLWMLLGSHNQGMWFDRVRFDQDVALNHIIEKGKLQAY